MNTLLIINPTSGQRRDDQQPELIPVLFADIPHEIRYTSGPGDAERMALESSLSGEFGAIVAFGGDGTINEIVNGVLKAPVGSAKPTIGIVPLGTANILSTELGIGLNSLEEAVRVIRGGNTRTIDVGTANGRYFTMMASFGLDAEAIKGVQPNVKGLMGAPAYILSGIAALAQYSASGVDVIIDGVLVHSEAFVIVVANTSSYGLEHLKIAPFAAIDDGWLDICIFEKPPNDKIGFLGQMLLLMARRHLGDPRVRYYRGKKVEISATPPMLGQIDGDIWRETPTQIELVPRAISFFAP